MQTADAQVAIRPISTVTDPEINSIHDPDEERCKEFDEIFELTVMAVTTAAAAASNGESLMTLPIENEHDSKMPPSIHEDIVYSQSMKIEPSSPSPSMNNNDHDEPNINKLEDLSQPEVKEVGSLEVTSPPRKRKFRLLRLHQNQQQIG